MYSRSSPRRRHGADLKALVLAACNEPGASIAGVAQAYGLNANLVHKWRRACSSQPFAPAVRDVPIGQIQPLPQPVEPASTFVPVQLAAPAPAPGITADAGAAIEVELCAGGVLKARVRWPLQAAAQCAAWLREVLR